MKLDIKKINEWKDIIKSHLFSNTNRMTEISNDRMILFMKMEGRIS